MHTDLLNIYNMKKSNRSEIESFILCHNNRGEVVRGSLLKLNRHRAVFEVYNPYSISQLSEVLKDFKIIMNDCTIYSGKAVVSSLINTGILLVCEVSLEDSWQEPDFLSDLYEGDRLEERFAAVKKDWEEVNNLIPDFKVVVADMQMLFYDLREWLEQVESAIQMGPVDSIKRERDVAQRLKTYILSTITSSFERFERAMSGIAEREHPIYHSFTKRQLHQWLLCSPFAERVFNKPLGYAGDYKMVNMLLSDPFEGSSLYSKMINLYFLTRPPAQAHRNRIQYLIEKIREETWRIAEQGGIARVFNIGCGPAKEVQGFLAQDDLCERAQFTLLDFDIDALHYTEKLLKEIKEKYCRNTSIEMVKKSVQELIKESSRSNGIGHGVHYDLIYCAGLFDYLSDRICKRLMNIFYNLLNPGGLLIATNVSSSNPNLNTMEFILEWHLIYRDDRQMRSLAPDFAHDSCCCVKSDSTGVNIFFEVRRPHNG